MSQQEVNNTPGGSVNSDSQTGDTGMPDGMTPEIAEGMETAYEAGYNTQVLHSGKSMEDVPDLKEVSKYRYNTQNDWVESVREEAQEIMGGGNPSADGEGPTALAPDSTPEPTATDGDGPSAIAPDA